MPTMFNLKPEPGAVVYPEVYYSVGFEVSTTVVKRGNLWLRGGSSFWAKTPLKVNRHVPFKRRFTFKGLHGFMFQKILQWFKQRITYVN
jgi:hypothetical protein